MVWLQGIEGNTVKQRRECRKRLALPPGSQRLSHPRLPAPGPPPRGWRSGPERRSGRRPEPGLGPPLRPARLQRRPLLPPLGGGCGGASGHPGNAAARLGVCGGVAGRTPPHADSLHSSRLTRQRAGRPLRSRSPAHSQLLLSASGRSAIPVPPPHCRELCCGGGSLDLVSPSPLRHSPPWVGCRQSPPLRSLLYFKTGGTAEGVPFLPEPASVGGVQYHCLPLPPISQLRTQSPRPCRRLHLPAGAFPTPTPPPAESPEPWLRQGCCSRGNELPHEAAARTCRSLTPLSREAWVGGRGALELWVPTLPPRTLHPALGQVSVRRTAPQVPFLSGGATGEVL